MRNWSPEKCADKSPVSRVVRGLRERLLGPWGALLVVGACYFVAAIGLGETERYLNWDEAVYYSQVAPDTHSIRFSASRSRGVTWLIYPLLQLRVELPRLRLLIALVHTLLLVFAFGAWIRLIGLTAVFAAAVFCTSWITVFYGTEISPNLPSALFSVAGVGYAIRSIEGGRRRMVVACIAFTCLAAVRPTDSVFVSLGLGFGALLLYPRRILRICTGPAVGVALGWLPWIIEAQIRFGGVLERLRGARRLVEGSGGVKLFFWHLIVVDGPIYQKRPSGEFPSQGVTWWACLITFSFASLWLIRKRREFKPAAFALFSSLFVFGAYVWFTGVARPRYLLPTYALISIPAAIGFIASFRWVGRRSAVAPALFLLAALGLGWTWHAGVLANIAQHELRVRSIYVRYGDAVRKAAAGRPCALGTQLFGPSVNVRSGCRTKVMYRRTERKTERFLNKRACEGDAVFLIANRRNLNKARRKYKKRRKGIIFEGWRARLIARGVYLYYPPVQGLRYCKLLEQRK